MRPDLDHHISFERVPSGYRQFGSYAVNIHHRMVSDKKIDVNVPVIQTIYIIAQRRQEPRYVAGTAGSTVPLLPMMTAVRLKRIHIEEPLAA